MKGYKIPLHALFKSFDDSSASIWMEGFVQACSLCTEASLGVFPWLSQISMRCFFICWASSHRFACLFVNFIQFMSPKHISHLLQMTELGFDCANNLYRQRVDVRRSWSNDWFDWSKSFSWIQKACIQRVQKGYLFLTFLEEMLPLLLGFCEIPTKCLPMVVINTEFRLETKHCFVYKVSLNCGWKSMTCLRKIRWIW